MSDEKHSINLVEWMRELDNRYADIENRLGQLEGSRENKKFMLNYEQSEREMKFDKWTIRIAVLTLLFDYLILPILGTNISSIISSIKGLV